MTMPPPTPKSALKNPAVSPIRISRTGTRLCYEAVADDALLERITTAPGEAGIFLDFDGVLAPIVARARGCVSALRRRAPSSCESWSAMRSSA